jgi:hypothetical protein
MLIDGRYRIQDANHHPAAVDHRLNPDWWPPRVVAGGEPCRQFLLEVGSVPVLTCGEIRQLAPVRVEPASPHRIVGTGLMVPGRTRRLP